MKKIKLLILMILVVCTSYVTYSNANAQNEPINLSIQQFEISDKIYDGQPINDPIVNFVDENNQPIILNREDYVITYEYSSFRQTTKPFLVDCYTAILEIVNDDYYCQNGYCTFEIIKASAFTVVINDITICENSEPKPPSYNIVGNCYDDLEEEYFLQINNEHKSFKQVNFLELPCGIYQISLSVDESLYFNYEDIIIQKANFFVNKLKMTTSYNGIIFEVAKPNGIKFNYTLQINSKNFNSNLFNKKQEVALAFNVCFMEENSIIELEDCTCKINFKVRDKDKFKVYSIIDGKLKSLPIKINEDNVVVLIDKTSDIIFVYEKTQIHFVIFTFILLLIGFVELILAIKKFKLNSNKLFSFSIPYMFLIYINYFDLALFILALWFVAFSSVLLYHSIVKDKKLKEQSKINVSLNNENFTREDEDLFNFISKAKQMEEYDLEEIIENEK